MSDEIASSCRTVCKPRPCTGAAACLRPAEQGCGSTSALCRPQAALCRPSASSSPGAGPCAVPSVDHHAVTAACLQLPHRLLVLKQHFSLHVSEPLLALQKTSDACLACINTGLM